MTLFWMNFCGLNKILNMLKATLKINVTITFPTVLI